MVKLVLFNLYVVLLLLASCSYDVVDITHVIDSNLNVTGNLTVDQTIYYNVDFAEAYYNNISNPLIQNLTGVNQWTIMEGFLINHYEGVILNDNNYSIQIVKPSYYKIAAHIAFSGGNSGDYELSVFVNETQNTHCTLYRSTSSSSIGSASFSCIDYYDAGENLTIRVRDTSSPAQNPSFYFINFNMVELI